MEIYINMGTTRQLDPIVFTNDDLEPITIPVTIGDKSYTLHEASGPAATKWRNACLRCFKTNRESGASTIEGLADTDSLLVSLCLTNDRKMWVPESEVKRFKPAIQKYLFEKIKEISDLHEDEQTEEQLEKKIEQLQNKLDGKREVRLKKAHRMGLEENSTDPTINGSSTVEK